MSGIDHQLEIIQMNEKENDHYVIPVVRASSYLRLAPNTFSIWTRPGPEFDINVQCLENAEARHFVRETGTGLTVEKKGMRLQVTELVGMTLTLSQMRQLKVAIDGALETFERLSKTTGTGTV
jgi:hypothetical protein